jgi:hypothetical protein
MFKSKRRQIVIPQSEHLRLVGALAMLWGNADFDLPLVERVSMVSGMALHDRGYGHLDNSAIGEMREEEWQGIARRSFSMYNSDVVSDTIIKYHCAPAGEVITILMNVRRSAAEFSQGY